MEINDIEKEIREKIAGEFLDSLSPELKEDLLKSSVERSMKEITTSYKLQSFISDKLEASAAVYLEKYLKSPGVQEQLQIQAREAVDVYLLAVTRSIAKDIERNMKSQYHNFIKPKEDNDD